MSSLLRNKEFITLLLHTSIEQAHYILGTLSIKQVRVLCKIAHNTLRGLLKKTQKLFPYKTIIRNLAAKNIALTEKKQIVKQHRRRILRWLKIMKSSLLLYLK